MTDIIADIPQKCNTFLYKEHNFKLYFSQSLNILLFLPIIKVQQYSWPESAETNLDKPGTVARKKMDFLFCYRPFISF